MEITPDTKSPKIYKNMHIKCTLPDIIPVEAKKHPLDAENIIYQITKTSNTPYQFKNIKIDLDNNLFLPKISMLNELRRTALEKVEEFAYNNIIRNCETTYPSLNISNISYNNEKVPISVLLNTMNLAYNYEDLDNAISNIYIPLKYFSMSSYRSSIDTLMQHHNIFIYMPTIVRSNYRNLLVSNIENTLEKYDIKGFVISNISNLQLLKTIDIDFCKYEIVGNYTLNICNNHTISNLKNLGIHKFTPSTELDKKSILDLCNSAILKKELIVFGKLPLMHTHYCLLGKTNKCYPTCTSKCNSDNKYYLKDRMNMNFRVLFDNIQTVSTIYNSKITSIIADDFDIDCARIDILDENIDEINFVVEQILKGARLEGKEYTNGNLNREI